MKQQTAVEWLEWVTDIELKSVEKGIINLTAFKLNLYFNINKAREMEKEQIKSAFNIGEYMAHDYFYGNHECAENYYNETYGGNK
jgi:hypothetical protein